MEKPIFYCDCDGVILNTIEVAFDIMRNNGCDMGNRSEIDHYFREVIDWRDIFEQARVINDAIERLRYIKDKRIFEDVKILTKLSGNSYEEELKRDLFRKELPNIQVITLAYKLNKDLVVPAKGNILLDDEIRNCKRWNDAEGVGILFSPYMQSLDNDVINDMSDLVYTKGVKKLLKTRNF